MISFWRTVMSWRHYHAPISCNINQQRPPPLQVWVRGEGRVGGNDRMLTAYKMTLLSQTLEGVRVNLVWGKGAKRWLLPGDMLLHQGDMLLHQGDKLLLRGEKLLLQEWWLLHGHGDTMNKCYKESSRTPWLGRWWNPATPGAQRLNCWVKLFK